MKKYVCKFDKSLLRHISSNQILGLASIVCLLVAEVLRYNNRDYSCKLSILGWGGFACFWLMSAFSLVGLISITYLSLFNFLILIIFYMQIDLVSAGIDTDNIYTFIGLDNFLKNQNPIVFVGETNSYFQFPLMFFTHLPDYLGLRLLGLKSLHLGVIFQIALLISILIYSVGPKGFCNKLLLSFIFSGCLSNRFVVNTYDITGYCISSICFGLIYLATQLTNDNNKAYKLNAFFLSISLLHYYISWFIIFPIFICSYLITEPSIKSFLNRLRTYLPLLFIIILLTATLILHPQTLLTRIFDITIKNDLHSSILTKLHNHWAFLTNVFPYHIYFNLMRSNFGDYHMLKDLASIGWVNFISSFLMLVLSLIYFSFYQNKRKSYFNFILFYLGSIFLTLATHIFTDFAIKRDILFISLFFFSSFFLFFKIDSINYTFKIILITIGISIASFNFYDLNRINANGYIHPSSQPNSFQTIERLKQSGFTFSKNTSIVLDNFFPAKVVYRKIFGAEWDHVQILSATDFCKNQSNAILDLLKKQCAELYLVLNTNFCDISSIQASNFKIATKGIYILYFNSKVNCENDSDSLNRLQSISILNFRGNQPSILYTKESTIVSSN